MSCKLVCNSLRDRKERVQAMKRFRLMTILVLVLALLLSCFVTDASAAKKSKKAKEATIQVRVNNAEFLYDEARSMLGLINEFRTGEDAWQLKKNNKTRQYVKKLKPLQYDYDLERVAMLRALELAVSFSHTRPNGTAWSTAFPKKCSTKGENLAYGQIDVYGAFTALREDDKDYNGQGHRRNMLRRNYTRVGFGAVRIGNTIYWAQEFASGKAGGSDADLFRSNIVEITWSALINSGAGNLGADPGELNLTIGQTAPIPEVTIYSHSGAKLTLPSSGWSIYDGVVVSDGSQLIASEVGSTCLTASVSGAEVYLPVNVFGSEPEPEPVPDVNPDYIPEPVPDDQITIEDYETPLGVKYFIMLTDDECFEFSFVLPDVFSSDK